MSHLIKNYTVDNFISEFVSINSETRILNAGSSSVRYGNNCVNVDIIEKHGVDIICDIQELPAGIGTFDIIICNAVLQYCKNPEKVASQLFRVLKPGGYLFVDAPWIQPYCQDTPDRFRFSEDALKQIFCDFQIIRIGPSIRSGSAFSMLGEHIAQRLTKNKYLNYILAAMTRIVLYPFRWIRTSAEGMTAGAFYLICRKES